MRALILITAAALLSACGNNDQTDNTQNVDENLSAESIVANDVTAIDAVTGDAANMAADVNYEEVNLPELNNAPAAAPASRSRRPTGNAAANAAASNATEQR